MEARREERTRSMLVFQGLFPRQAVKIILIIAAMAMIGCALPSLKKTDTRSRFTFTRTKFIAHNPWVRDEVSSFLAREEVRSALGFDPLHFDKPLIIHISDDMFPQSLGQEINEKVIIDGHLFSDRIYIDGLVIRARSTVRYGEEICMLRELRNDQAVLKLFRNLVVAHEVAHVREYYAYGEDTHLTLTGHNVTDRIETNILTRLYHGGAITRDLCRRVFRIITKYRNNNGESIASIERYYRSDLMMYPMPVFAFRHEEAVRK